MKFIFWLTYMVKEHMDVVPKFLRRSLIFILLCIFHDILKLNPSGFLEFWLLIVVIVTNNLYQLLINNLDKNGF